MQIAKVTGTVVSSVKDERLTASKLLVVVPVEVDGSDRAQSPIVAVDLVGAGTGEVVLVVQGSTASRAVSETKPPVDAAIIGIVDTIRTGTSVTYSKD